MGWGVEAEDATIPVIHCLPVIMVKFLFKEKKRNDFDDKTKNKEWKIKKKKLSDSRCRFSVICNTIFLENCGKI